MFTLPRRIRPRHRWPGPTAVVELPDGGQVTVPASLAGEVRAAAARRVGEQLGRAVRAELDRQASPAVVQLAGVSAADLVTPPVELAGGITAADAFRMLERLERQVARVAARQSWPSLNVEHARTRPGYVWEVTSPRGEHLAGDVEPSHAAALQRGLAELAAATVQHALGAGATLPAELAAPVGA